MTIKRITQVLIKKYSVTNNQTVTCQYWCFQSGTCLYFLFSKHGAQSTFSVGKTMKNRSSWKQKGITRLINTNNCLLVKHQIPKVLNRKERWIDLEWSIRYPPKSFFCLEIRTVAFLHYLEMQKNIVMVWFGSLCEHHLKPVNFTLKCLI